MKETQYIRCPRCELNYIQKKDKLCSVCQAELNADSSYDELDMETCPICKTNFIRPDEIMCAQCAKERQINGENVGLDDDWENYVDPSDEELASEDEETGDMARVTDLEDDDLDDLETDDDDLPEIDEELDFVDDDEEEEDEDEDDEDDDEDFDDEDDDF